MLALFPEGFEERTDGDLVELAAYTDAAGEARMAGAFEAVVGEDVAEDWEERWKEFHEPLTLASLWIGPPWRTPPPDLLAVVIDPGRAFGTGSHGTTRLCLELLEELPRGSLLDVGCGSGVLAIAAAKLGFGPVAALDLDPNAVAATEANAAVNGVAVEVRRADALSEPLPPADTAVANIALEAVETVLARVSSPLVVTSGYVRGDSPRAPGFEHVRHVESEGWSADVWRRR
jgi:ribosomal protein L11 methyltransferase